MNGYGIDSLHGAVGPEIVAGHAPETAGEVALGGATLRALGKHVGDLVTARGPRASRQYRVVGQVALAQFVATDEQRLDSGAVFTRAGYAPVSDQNSLTRFVIGDYAAGADRATVDRLINALPGVKPDAVSAVFTSDPSVIHATRPPEINRLRGLDWFPPALSILLSVLALAAVGHAVFTAARRRRKELAVLKTLGFRRGQVRSTVAWQATTLGLVGAVVGIPLGALVGTFAWHRVSNNLGIAQITVVPVVALVATVVIVLVVVNAVAFWPARVAARAWPAPALAAE